MYTSVDKFNLKRKFLTQIQENIQCLNQIIKKLL
jgi:hypothetical protein